MIAVRLQKAADDLLGQEDVAVREQARRGHDRRRQARELRHMSRGHLRLGGSPRRPEQNLQGIPTCRQRRVDVHRGQEGLDGGIGIVYRDIAMAALLIKAAEARMQALQAREGIERLGDLAEIALAHGNEVQGITILRCRGQQPITRGQRLGEPLRLNQTLNPHNLRLDGQGIRGRGAGIDGRSCHGKDPSASFNGPSHGS